MQLKDSHVAVINRTVPARMLYRIAPQSSVFSLLSAHSCGDSAFALCLQDDDPYVRKTAAMCVAKLHDINSELVEDQGFLDTLKVLLALVYSHEIEFSGS